MTADRFEARELKSHSESIAWNHLRVGSIYFFVNFADEKMLIPVMNTVVYIGENLEPEDDNVVYFQDIDSFNRGVRYGEVGDDDYALFETGTKDELGHVFEFDQALNELLACSLRREKTTEQHA